MRRALGLRDFDWMLLGMVLLLCTISVFEIYSATLHTKFVGFHTKQMYWIGAGIVPSLPLPSVSKVYVMSSTRASKNQ